jgi:hypothetical protein
MSFIRNGCGGIFPLFTFYMYDGLGYQVRRSFSVLGAMEEELLTFLSYSWLLVAVGVLPCRLHRSRTCSDTVRPLPVRSVDSSEGERGFLSSPFSTFF